MTQKHLILIYYLDLNAIVLSNHKGWYAIKTKKSNPIRKWSNYRSNLQMNYNCWVGIHVEYLILIIPMCE